MADYDPQNVFARILRQEIPARTLLETEHSLAFHDVSPQAPVHVLVIPKGAYVDFADFATNASTAEITDFNRAVAEVCRMTEVTENGYRLIMNSGAEGGQEVPHLHVHVLGGRALGPMLMHD